MPEYNSSGNVADGGEFVAAASPYTTAAEVAALGYSSVAMDPSTYNGQASFDTFCLQESVTVNANTQYYYKRVTAAAD